MIRRLRAFLRDRLAWLDEDDPTDAPSYVDVGVVTDPKED